MFIVNYIDSTKRFEASSGKLEVGRAEDGSFSSSLFFRFFRKKLKKEVDFLLKKKMLNGIQTSGISASREA